MKLRWPFMLRSTHEQIVWDVEERLTPRWTLDGMELHPKGVKLQLRRHGKSPLGSTVPQTLHLIVNPFRPYPRESLGRIMFGWSKDEDAIGEIVQEPMRTYDTEARALIAVVNRAGDFYVPGDQLPADTFEKEEKPR